VLAEELNEILGEHDVADRTGCLRLREAAARRPLPPDLELRALEGDVGPGQTNSVQRMPPAVDRFRVALEEGDVGPGQTNSVQRMPPAVDRFRVALEEGEITHDGDEDLRRHILNGRLRKVGRDESGLGRYTLEKAGPGRLIDGLVASVLAYEAAAQIPESGDVVWAVA
jgi:hypothetical protein